MDVLALNDELLEAQAEDIISDREEDGGSNRYADDEKRVIDRLAAGRPVDVLHLAARVFDVFR